MRGPGGQLPAFGSGPLHRPEQAYDRVSFDHLAVASNLAAEHGWLGFYARTADSGEAGYHVYNRFPPAGYFLIKLALLTRPGDLHGQVQAARILMLAFFAGAAVLAWAALALITGRRWLAVSAALAGRDRAELRRLALFGALALLFALAVLAPSAGSHGVDVRGVEASYAASGLWRRGALAKLPLRGEHDSAPGQGASAWRSASRSPTAIGGSRW